MNDHSSEQKIISRKGARTPAQTKGNKVESAGSKPTRTMYIKSRRKQKSAKLAKRKRVKQPPRAEMQPTREPKAKGGTMGVNRPNKSTKRDTGNQKESRTSRQGLTRGNKGSNYKRSSKERSKGKGVHSSRWKAMTLEIVIQ